MGSDNFEAFVDKDADSTIFGGDICGPITQSMNESMFQLVILKWRSAFEGLKETNNYKFLSAAGSLMKTMVIFTFLIQSSVSLPLLAQQIYASIVYYFVDDVSISISLLADNLHLV